MKIKKVIYLFIIGMMILTVIASCQTKTLSGNEYSLSFYKSEYENYKKEYETCKEWLERAEELRDAISNDYRYAIREITPTLKPEVAKKIISNVDKNVIAAIKGRKLSELAKYVHPDKGVRISCLNEASTEDIILKSKDFLSNRVYKWDFEYAEGGMEESISGLFDALIYAKDYAQYTPIYNPMKLSDTHSQALGNDYIFYDKCIVVLYLYEGDDEWVRMDWSGLKLIYQEHSDGKWYLTGIVHCSRLM